MSQLGVWIISWLNWNNYKYLIILNDCFISFHKALIVYNNLCHKLFSFNLFFRNFGNAVAILIAHYKRRHLLREAADSVPPSQLRWAVTTGWNLNIENILISVLSKSMYINFYALFILVMLIHKALRSQTHMNKELNWRYLFLSICVKEKKPSSRKILILYFF